MVGDGGARRPRVQVLQPHQPQSGQQAFGK